jgi:hypothetical protein
MKSVCSLAFAGLLAAVVPAAAQDKPFSMAGTWLNKGESVSIGESHHPEHHVRESEPKVVQTSLRFVIDTHVGTSFWGTATGASGAPERIVGATNGKRGSAVNARGGIYQFVVVDANTLETCYAVRTDKHLAASCTTWTRQ